MSTLYTTYKETGKKELMDALKVKNIHMVPSIEKIIVAMGVGSLVTRKNVKDISDLESNIAMMTGQKPHVILSKKAVSNFKLRVGQPVMLRSTLRGKKAFDFVDRLVKYVLPRVRDFSGLSARKFDRTGNYTLGLANQAVFPELSPDDIKTTHGLQITICTTADSSSSSKALLEKLGLIFANK